jgi:hypothetical protein
LEHDGPDRLVERTGRRGKQFDELEIDLDCRSSSLDNLEYRK